MTKRVKKDSEPQRPYAATERGMILETALGLTEGERNKQYGSAYENMANLGNMIQQYFACKYGGMTVDFMQEVDAAGSAKFKVSPEDAAWIMVLTKMCRTFSGVYHRDNFVDAAAYAAIAGECAAEDTRWMEED